MEGHMYSCRYPKNGAKGKKVAPLNDPRVEVSASMPSVAPAHTDMRSDRTYPGIAANANYGRLFQRHASRYGVDGPDNHGRTNGVGRKSG
jgi:hypothetical protein